MSKLDLPPRPTLQEALKPLLEKTGEQGAQARRDLREARRTSPALMVTSLEKVGWELQAVRQQLECLNRNLEGRGQNLRPSPWNPKKLAWSLAYIVTVAVVAVISVYLAYRFHRR